jgi:capsular exopolysaccharide synthesis family protein
MSSPENGYTITKSAIIRESFRMVVASVIQNASAEQQCRVLVITSPGAGEGKTTVTTNIARAMCETGRRVVVVDADLHRPRLDKVLGVEGKPGLFEVLSGHEPVNAIFLKTLLAATDTEGLVILPAGNASDDVAKLFHSDRLQQVLTVLNTCFDFVLVDAPPLLRFSETRLLGKIADGVLLVLRSGSTDESVALASRHLLADDNIRLVGTVLNDWKVPDDSVYASFYYGGARSTK